MRVLVVSGFLGAGKTTFIQELARRSGRDFVIYENELGQGDVDATLLRDTTELSVWESTENCICCTGRQGFLESVLTILSTLDPEFLVVEPTGAALLSGIVENLARTEFERIEVLPPIAVVDATAFTAQKSHYPSISVDQVEHADVILCSKTELALPEEVGALVEELARLNPSARIVATPYSLEPDSWFASLLEAPASHPRVPVDDKSTSQDEDFEQVSFSGIDLDNPVQLFALLDGIVSGRLGDVPRAKGTLRYGSGDPHWLRFDVVDHTWAVTGAEAQDEGQAVFIGRGLMRRELREALGILRRTHAPAAVELEPHAHGRHHGHEGD